MEIPISPITLSSSESSDSNSGIPLVEKCDSVIIVDSSDIERTHLGWEKRKKSVKCTVPNTPVSNIQKVADWIKSIEESNKYNDETACSDEIYESDIEKNNLVEECKGFVVVRCDYMKPISSKQTKDKKGCIKPIFSRKVKNRSEIKNSSISMPKKNKFLSVTKASDNVLDKICFHSPIDKDSYSSSIKLIDDKSDISSDMCDIPKSIEIRKKELCTYLKLMDPSDKKEILELQNRRSTRVRNLAALQERIKLEKKIVENSSQDSSEKHEPNNYLEKLKRNKNDVTSSKYKQKIRGSRTSSKSSQHSSALNNMVLKNNEISTLKKTNLIPEAEINPTMKSYKELNIQHLETPSPTITDKLEESIPESECTKTSFYNSISSNNLTKIENFDSVMEELIPKYKTAIAKRTRRKSLSTNSFESSFAKNKENIECKEGNIEKEKTEHQTPNDISSIGNVTKDKKTAEKVINKATYKDENLKCGNQVKNGKNNLSNKCYNFKLRSAKFKIRLKKIPSKKQLFRNRKNIRNNFNRPKLDLKSKPKNQPKKQENSSYVENNISPKEESKLEEKNLDKELTKETCSEISLDVLHSCKEVENDSLDLQNLMVDVDDFNNLTDEHKKLLIESRLLLDASPCSYKEHHLFQGQEELPPLYGFSTSDVNEIKLMCEIFEQSILKHSQKPFKNSSESNQPQEVIGNKINLENVTQNETSLVRENIELVSNLKDHNYTPLGDGENENTHKCISENVNETSNSLTKPLKEKPLEQTNRYLEINPNDVEENNCVILPFDRNVEVKSLQKSLHFVKKKIINSPEVHVSHEWDVEESIRPKPKRLSHCITIDKENGDLLKAFYVDFNLIICQEFLISFWMQTPLGNILGSQDMWIPRGHTQRLVLNNKCVQKGSNEMVFCSETNVAYMEFWTKEHKSDIREGPVADIFITIYFWRQRQNGIDKKVLQLENINGFADDVQYCVMKSSLTIIVSWHAANEGNDPRGTFVHAYQLAPDYQMVSHISDFEPIEHYVSSLHNIQGCDNLIMGCGEQKITLWNVDYGHKIATIELSGIGSELSTLWVKCDRGFLFAIQQCGNKELRLIAINGINHSWKKLANYFPADGFERLKGVCIENGLLLSFYDKGVLCWKAETGEPVEEIIIDTEFFTCGNFLIFLEENKIFVRHCITHLLSMSVDEQ